MESLRHIFILAIIALFSAASHAETFVVCVGINNYESPNVKNLTRSENDAKSISAFYKKATKNVILITGKYATKERIFKCLKKQFARATAKDKIVFFFSGHGFPGGFCPYDYNRLGSGLMYSEITQIMKKSKASCKFIFADACNSGALRQNGNGKKHSDTDVLLFLSSRSNEFSLESPGQNNSFFTNDLIRGLRGGADANKDRKITALELFKFVSKSVRTATKGKQHPVMWGNFADSKVIVDYSKK